MFSAYAKIASQKYREVYGLDFEQFQVGQIFKHRPGVTVSQEDNKNEALSTTNFAQLHYDGNYGASTEWKQCLVVSTVTIKRVIGMTWKTFFKKLRIERFNSIAMLHPVFSGDTIYSESEILEIIISDSPDTGKILVETRGFNQSNILITKIQYVIAVYRQGKHPYYQSLAIENLEDRFSAYKNANNTLMEQSGLFFEDFNQGEIYEHFPSRKFYADESINNDLLALEWNPKYVNSNYYKQYFGLPLNPINEMSALTIVTTATTRTFGKVVANLEWKNIELKREVFPDEEFFTESEIIAKKESKSRPTQGILTVTTRAFDSSKSIVVSFERVLLVYRNNAPTYLNSNY
ncbi:MAG: MaoC/PaaZ C-terminal domain-containing protein [Alphaproteobacteria bacterium]|nr:MaoC/PaaZ C-terminal domain-containing protein [Alphaproteobacteria bacterium]